MTDNTLSMFDKLLGTFARRSERQNAESALKSLRKSQKELRNLTRAGRVIIDAKNNGTDPIAAIESIMSWEAFVESVSTTERLAEPHTSNSKVELLNKHQTIRRFAPALLVCLDFKGHPSVKPVLDAINCLKIMYQTPKRKLAANPPTKFIPSIWRPHVYPNGELDPKAYEICALLELRNRLRARDIWVEGSLAYQSFESNLIPKETFALLKEEGPLPLSIPQDFDVYVAERKALLSERMHEVASLAAKGDLEDVELLKGELHIAALRDKTPPQASKLRDATYRLMPRIKITDLLLEVDQWTGFSDCFVHHRSGHPAENKNLLMTSILADGINIGLSNMAEACRGITMRKLAWCHDWYINEDSYTDALARIIDIHRQLPLAQSWGKGVTSSSDGQYFRAGGHGEALADCNARHGSEPGIAYYTHISDQYGPYFVQVITASTGEAPHVLDGLLYHRTGLTIEEHYTDTGGASDHVFALCYLFGFLFAPRLKDIKERKIHYFQGQKTPTKLYNQIGDPIDLKNLESHWEDIQRMGTSILSGTVTASKILKVLSSHPRQSGLAKALRDMGRIERSLFMLDWYKKPALRRRSNAGLNKGESRNALARAVHFNRLGEIRDRSFENQVYKASGLNLLVSAIILWNTQYLKLALDELRKQGFHVDDSLIKHISPLGWEHVILTGDYVWETLDLPEKDMFRPLRNNFSLLAA